MTLMDNIFAGENGIAVSLLAKFGIAGSLTIKDDINYNPSDGSSTDTQGTTFVVQVTPALQYSTRDIDGTNILKSDLYCFISPEDLALDISIITPGQLNHSAIEINDKCYNIVAVQSIYSGEQNAAYKLQLREDNK